MADILSQEEVDLLLSSVDEAVPDQDLAARPEDEGPVLSTYDFRRPERVSKDQLKGLQSLFEAFSRGAVKLRSKDPAIDPFVEENMLSDARDVARMRDGIRRQARVLRQAPIAAIAEDIRYPLTGHALAEVEAMDDAALDRFMLGEASDAQHAAGTCRMGPASDPASVVDPLCRVHGLEALRVVDAAIMPADCRANTHLTTVMIGEKIADAMASA